MKSDSEGAEIMKVFIGMGVLLFLTTIGIGGCTYLAACGDAKVDAANQTQTTGTSK